MGKPDALSRRADHGSGQGDNNNLTLLAPELFRIHALSGARFHGNNQNILQEVWCSLKGSVQEESIAKVARELQKDKGRGTVKSADTPQAPYPHVDRSWPKLSNVYQSSYAEFQCDDSSHTQSQ
jgi:hypothetical protein